MIFTDLYYLLEICYDILLYLSFDDESASEIEEGSSFCSFLSSLRFTRGYILSGWEDSVTLPHPCVNWGSCEIYGMVYISYHKQKLEKRTLLMKNRLKQNNTLS